MKIAIEAQRIFRTNKHGMDFVALESIRELQKIDKENEYFIVYYLIVIFLHKLSTSECGIRPMFH